MYNPSHEANRERCSLLKPHARGWPYLRQLRQSLLGRVAFSRVFCLFATFACLQTEAANLPAPTLSAPANTATGVSTIPTYSWSAVNGVISAGYYLAVATSSADLKSVE